MTRTQIAATLGPACAEEETLRAMIRAGASAFRINFSQDSLEGHALLLRQLRRAADTEGQRVIVMGDLCGPRFRIGLDLPQPVLLEAGQVIRLCEEGDGKESGCYGINYEHFSQDVAVGDRILVDEGRLKLQVEEIEGATVSCRVEKGGTLYGGKGINLPDTHISIPILTDTDLACVRWAQSQQLDWLLLSFVREAEHVSSLREYLESLGSSMQVVSKIETYQATQNLEAISVVSDQLLIARGDLGVEMGPEQVPMLQRRISAWGRQQGKPVILATHIFHSMMDHPEPTRAEVSDVAHAVMDGVTMLMLTGESAIGRYPVETVQALHNTIQAVESTQDNNGSDMC